MIDTSAPHWQIDLSHDPERGPFGEFTPRRHVIGKCAECGRAFEHVVEQQRQFIVGIWIPLSRDVIQRRIAEHERDVAVAISAHAELVRTVGVCEHDGRHSDAESDDEDEWE